MSHLHLPPVYSLRFFACFGWSYFLPIPLSLAADVEQADNLPVVTVLGGVAEHELPAGLATPRATQRVGASSNSVDRDVLGALQPDRVEQLTGLIPGAHSGFEHGGLETGIRMRGFDVTRPRWNGLPDIHRLFVRDMYTVSEVEFVSGPDAILEGVTSPGGAIRYVGRRPEYEPARELGVEVGEPGQRRVTLDSTGPVGEDVAYRLTFAAQDGETDPGQLSTRHYHALIGLAWHYSPRGELRIEHERQRNQRPYNMGTVITADGPVLDRAYHSSEQESKREYERSALYWEHELGASWSVSAKAAHARVERDELLIGFWSGGILPFPADDLDLLGYYAELEDDYKQDDVRVQIDWDGQLRGVGQHWVIGADWHRRDIAFRRTQAASQGWESQYCVPVDGAAGEVIVDSGTLECVPGSGGQRIAFSELDLSSLELASLQYRPEKTDRIGAYLANRVRFTDYWRLGWGVRHTDYRIRAATEDDPQLREMADAGELTWQWGTAIGSERLEVFANTGTGMELTGRVDADGNPLPPVKSQVHEAGCKLRPTPQQRIRMAWFSNEQTDSQARDYSAGDPLVFKIAGDRSTHGVELRYDFASKGWEGRFNIVEQRGEEQPVEVGSDKREAITDTPERLLGGRLAYDFSLNFAIPLEVWWLGEYVGERSAGRDGDDDDEVMVASYARHDIGANYTWESGPELQVRVRNLMDDSYLRAMRVQGERRRLYMGLMHSF